MEITQLDLLLRKLPLASIRGREVVDGEKPAKRQRGAFKKMRLDRKE